MAETEKKTVILDFQVDENDAVISIEKLTKANKELREERKKVDLSTEDGIKKVRDINTQIEKNTQTITTNSTTIEKNRANVGNYTESINKSKVGQADFNKTLGDATPVLDKMSGGLVSTAQGFMGMVKASLAFIATPIGAVIAAIGVAISGLIAYFKRTEDGGDKLNKIIFTMSAIFGKFMDVMSGVGEAIFSAIENPREAIKNFGEFLKAQIINRFMGILELIPNLGKAIGLLFKGEFAEAGKVAGDAVLKVTLGVEDGVDMIKSFASEVGEMVNEAIKQGDRLSKLDQKLGDQEEALTIQRAKTALQVAKIRSEALTKEGDQRRALIEEAIALEQKLSDAEVAFAETKKQIALEEQEIDGVTGESKQAVAEAIAAVINAEASRYESTLRFSKELESLDNAEAARKAKLAAEQEAANKKADDARKKRSDTAAKETAAWFDAKFKAEMEQIEFEEQNAIDAVAREKRKQDEILNAITSTLDVAKSFTSQFTDYQQREYELQENALAVDLANKTQQLNDQYATEVQALDDKLSKGELSQEEYDKAILALDKKLKEDSTKADVEQRKKLDVIKKRAFESNKKTQIAETVIQVAQAALAAFRALAGVPFVGPILGAAAAAAAVVFGAKKISDIKKEQFVPATFRTGGYTGDGDPNQLAGQVHRAEFVMPADVVARYGKEHFQSYMDGSVVANASTNGMQQNQQQQKIVVYASWTEFKKFENEMKMKETITSV